MQLQQPESKTTADPSSGAAATSSSAIELPTDWTVPKNMSLDNIIRDISKGVSTRSQLSQFCLNVAFVSQLELKSVSDALKDDHWFLAMQDELDQFKRNDVWDLVPRTKTQQIIGTKWVFRNKLDDSGMIIKNKARLVAKGYCQEEGIDYDETYTPVARLEAIRILLAISSLLQFKLFQMDMKSAFLNGFIKEEVYVAQPPGLTDYEFPDHVYKLKKELYGLKQAPRSWYERLSEFFIQSDFRKGKVDSTLFIKKAKNDLLFVQIYVDDIFFGSTNSLLC